MAARKSKIACLYRSSAKRPRILNGSLLAFPVRAALEDVLPRLCPVRSPPALSGDPLILEFCLTFASRRLASDRALCTGGLHHPCWSLCSCTRERAARHNCGYVHPCTNARPPDVDPAGAPTDMARSRCGETNSRLAHHGHTARRVACRRWRERNLCNQRCPSVVIHGA